MKNWPFLQHFFLGSLHSINKAKAPPFTNTLISSSNYEDPTQTSEKIQETSLPPVLLLPFYYHQFKTIRDNYYKRKVSQLKVWRYMLVNPHTQKLRQEDHNFRVQTSIGYTVSYLLAQKILNQPQGTSLPHINLSPIHQCAVSLKMTTMW